MQHRAAFFNADNGLVTSTDPVWMQGEFDILTVLFDRVGLQENVRKRVRMIFCPCRSAGNQSKAAYKQ